MVCSRCCYGSVNPNDRTGCSIDWRRLELLIYIFRHIPHQNHSIKYMLNYGISESISYSLGLITKYKEVFVFFYYNNRLKLLVITIAPSIQNDHLVNVGLFLLRPYISSIKVNKNGRQGSIRFPLKFDCVRHHILFLVFKIITGRNHH